MNKARRTFLMATMISLIPVMSQAAPPEGEAGDMPPPPPHPTCSYSEHTCVVTAPDLSFVVSKINNIVPSSSNDCKLLPPCGHRPPPPPRPRAGENPPPDNNLP